LGEAWETTAWMHDSMDGGGRAASGTAAEEVEPRRERRSRVPQMSSKSPLPQVGEGSRDFLALCRCL
jgi:hypothetical protein